MIGSAGPAGSGAVIPFSISLSSIYLGTDINGIPSDIIPLGFIGAINSTGDYAGFRLMDGEWEKGSITINKTRKHLASFIVPREMILKRAFVMVSTTSDPMTGDNSIVKPFVCLAISQTNDYEYKILKESMVYTEPFVYGEYEAYSSRRGSAVDLNVKIPQGALVSILAGIEQSGAESMDNGLYCAISGGLYFE